MRSLALALALTLLVGCEAAHSGDCAPQDVCTCPGSMICNWNCTTIYPGGGCGFECTSSGGCNLVCNGGGCLAVNRGSGPLTLSCTGRNCTVHCLGTGSCTITDCPGCICNAPSAVSCTVVK
jgi:hypothetical protein